VLLSIDRPDFRGTS
jgi:sulfur relay (sulfurtransferase) complex TusBCD TusD component (DsrE family)/SAM-dependent methyltransferase